MAIQIVYGEARRFQYLLDNERLTEYDKDAFKSLLLSDMKESVLCSSLRILSELPRRINRICEKSLMYASQQGKRLIDEHLVRYIIEHEMLGGDV